MIITRSPYRISFFGGGTDYHTWYEEHGGEVLSTSINHYNYISCRYLPPFHPEYKNRIAWRILEYPNCIEEIQHNAIRGALKYYDVKRGIELSNQCDLPARSGLGSSSTFSAALIMAIKALKGKMISKEDLALETINLERNVLKENVGIQDQIATVYGGLNHIIINQAGEFKVEPVIINEKRKKHFNDHLLLFFTGISRTSSEVCKKQIDSAPNNTKQLTRMQAMVKDAIDVLTSGRLEDFGGLLHEAWMLKRSLTDNISTSYIDDIYKTAVQNGAIGGKVLGAGGGGFMLFFAKPEYHGRIKEALRSFIQVPFKFETNGTQIIHYAPKLYSLHSYERLKYITEEGIKEFELAK